MKLANTQDAHILLHYAREFGLQAKLNVRLTEAFFGEQKDISNREVLDQELGSVGLNAGEALKTLEDDNAHEQVQTQEAYWLGKGISEVLTMILGVLIFLPGLNKFFEPAHTKFMDQIVSIRACLN